MPQLAWAALALALVAAVIALAREVRLRRALTRVLHHLLKHWRTDVKSREERRLDP